ncbi:MAG: hypothetical protein Q3988_06165 [Gemella sp.]|nr:hypothetical protein [Gemella sp.]
MNKKGKVTVGILSSVLLITPITAVINSNEAYARNTSVNAGGVQISQRDMEIFQRELKKELMKDPVFAKEVTQEEFGPKTKAIVFAAKKMKAKLYKIGSRKFNQYIQNAANRIPNKKVRDFIKRNVTYNRVATMLTITTQADGHITDYLAGRFRAMGMNATAAGILSRTVVWFLL